MIEEARHAEEQEDADGDEHAAERGPQRVARLEHERERDDRGDIRKRHLRHHRQRARIVEQACSSSAGSRIAADPLASRRA